jgi:hypothetical protein
MRLTRATESRSRRATSANAFPACLLVVHDGKDDHGRTNFRLVSLGTDELWR